MNKTTVFLVIAILLTVFSLSMGRRGSDAEAQSNSNSATSLDNPNAVIDFSDRTDSQLNSVGSNSVLPGPGQFTTGNGPSTGDGALGDTMGNQTFNTFSETTPINNGPNTTGSTGPSTTGTNNNADDSGSTGGGFGQSNQGSGDTGSGTPIGSPSGSSGAPGPRM